MATDTTSITVTAPPLTIGDRGQAVMTNSAYRRELMTELERFFGRCAAGCAPPGVLVAVQQNTNETAAKSTGTITFSTVAVGNSVAVNGVPFTCVTASAGVNEFVKGASDTTAAAALAAAINASTDVRIAGQLTATSALGVVTVTAVAYGLDGNAITLEALGTLATATVTYSSSSGVQTVVINGVSIAVGTGASDNANAIACAAAINASVNALVKGYVIACRQAATAVVSIYSLIPGVMGNAVSLSVTGTGATASAAQLTGGVQEGASSSGTITITPTGSGNYVATIGGVAVASVPFTTSEANTCTLLAQQINATAGLLGMVYATAATNIVTVKASRPGIAGNAIGLACTGTNASVSGARLTAGAAPTTIVAAGGATIEGTANGVTLASGVGGEATVQTFQF